MGCSFCTKDLQPGNGKENRKISQLFNHRSELFPIQEELLTDDFTRV